MNGLTKYHASEYDKVKVSGGAFVMPCDENCGRIAVRVQKIFNGASLLTHGVFTSSLSALAPAAYTPPLTYVSARYAGDAEITSYRVSAVSGTSRSRLTIAFEYDVVVTYEDAAGACGTARARVKDAADILITLPASPYTISASVDFASAIGEISFPNVDMTACRRLAVKVLVPCDVVLCACGSITLPDARSVEDEVCRLLV